MGYVWRKDLYIFLDDTNSCSTCKQLIDTIQAISNHSKKNTANILGVNTWNTVGCGVIVRREMYHDIIDNTVLIEARHADI